MLEMTVRGCIVLFLCAFPLRGTNSALTAHVEGYLYSLADANDPLPPVVVTPPFDEIPSQDYQACYNISRLSGSRGREIAFYGRVIYSRQFLTPCRVELDVTPCGARPRIRAHHFEPVDESGIWVQPQSKSMPAVPVAFKSIYIECPALSAADAVNFLANDSMTNATGTVLLTVPPQWPVYCILTGFILHYWIARRSLTQFNS